MNAVAEYIPETYQKAGKTFRNRHPLEDLKELCPNPEVILDCGSGAGYFAGECFRAFPEATVWSFEPVKELFQKLIQVNPNSSCAALSDFNGTSTINLTAAPKSNSLLGFLPGNPLDNLLKVVGTEEIIVRRLDDWLENGRIDPATVGILKMDVQGCEIRLMKGAKNLLTHHPVILAEVAYQQQYLNQPLIEDVDAFLSQFGYLRKFLYESARPDIWGDAIYTYQGETIDGEPVARRQPSPIRLNIGAGSTVIDGWTAIDRKFGTEAFPLNYPDNSVEEIRASHILEHLSFKEIPAALEEWRRVLKPGGRLRISVPDFGKISDTRTSDPHWPYYLMGGQRDDQDFHHSVFDEARLLAYLHAAGLVNPQRWESPNTDTASHPISLNIEAFKPQDSAPESQKLKIRAVMSVPRIGWNDASSAIDDMLYPFGIRCSRFNGVFWGQCMQRNFEEAVAEGLDWLLCIDYDSMVTALHLNELMGQFGRNPHIDALASLQMRRGQDYPLMTVGKEGRPEISNEPIKVTSAHFGLTLIRVDSLKDVLKPWFFSKPDDSGGWGDGRLDDDIWFWHQWRKAGKTVYVAPTVRIGHLELMVSEFDENLQPRHIHIGDWWKANGAR